jgi:anti-sigma B factor antagonist
MRVSKRERNEVIILDISGNLMGGPETDAFHRLIKDSLGEGHRRFLINLAKVKWVNSLGLGTLIAAYKSICDANGEMKLLKLDQRVKSILMITRLLILFEVYSREDEAIASFIDNSEGESAVAADRDAAPKAATSTLAAKAAAQDERGN